MDTKEVIDLMDSDDDGDDEGHDEGPDVVKAQVGSLRPVTAMTVDNESTRSGTAQRSRFASFSSETSSTNNYNNYNASRRIGDNNVFVVDHRGEEPFEQQLPKEPEVIGINFCGEVIDLEDTHNNEIDTREEYEAKFVPIPPPEAPSVQEQKLPKVNHPRKILEAARKRRLLLQQQQQGKKALQQQPATKKAELTTPAVAATAAGASRLQSTKKRPNTNAANSKSSTAAGTTTTAATTTKPTVRPMPAANATARLRKPSFRQVAAAVAAAAAVDKPAENDRNNGNGGCNFIVIDDDNDDDDDFTVHVPAPKPTHAGPAGHARPKFPSSRSTNRLPYGGVIAGGRRAHEFKSCTLRVPTDSELQEHFQDGGEGTKKRTKYFQAGCNYNMNMTEESAAEMQDRLLREAAAKLKAQHQQHRVVIVRSVQPNIPIFEHIMLDIAVSHPDHWMWKDPYACLGLPPASSVTAVKKQYRRLARAYHPDKSLQANTATKFHAVTMAYRRLVDALNSVEGIVGDAESGGEDNHHESS